MPETTTTTTTTTTTPSQMSGEALRTAAALVTKSGNPTAEATRAKRELNRRAKARKAKAAERKTSAPVAEAGPVLDPEVKAAAIALAKSLAEDDVEAGQGKFMARFIVRRRECLGMAALAPLDPPVAAVA